MQFQRGTPARVNGFSRCSLNGVHSPWPLDFIAAADEGTAPDCIDPATPTVLVDLLVAREGIERKRRLKAVLIWQMDYEGRDHLAH